MKKILLSLITAFCVCSVAMAQEPVKIQAKKRNVSLTAVSASPSDDKAEMAERLKAKQKHFEAMRASTTQTSAGAAKAEETNGSKKKKVN